MSTDVVVTGFPNAQKDYAVRICRFARSMLKTFHRDIAELALKLGPDTNALALRIGIHSGRPYHRLAKRGDYVISHFHRVTAGVLRGERARVQPFGDTMNFASRMEKRAASTL